MARMLGNTHDVDAGGKKCICCYHSPRQRVKMNRSAKRRERQQWRKEVA